MFCLAVEWVLAMLWNPLLFPAVLLGAMNMQLTEKLITSTQCNRRRKMGHSDLFCCFLPLWSQNGSPVLSWFSFASSLALFFLQVPFSLILNMISCVGYFEPLYFWTSWMQLCSVFSCQRTCGSLRPWCWVVPYCKKIDSFSQSDRLDQLG